MAKKVALTLLCGALALSLLLWAYFAIVTPGDTPAAITLDAAAARIELGAAEISDDTMQLTLDPSGLGVLDWSQVGIDAGHYPLLYFALRGPLPALPPVVFWRFADTGRDLAYYGVPGVPRSSHWLSLSDSPLWRGNPAELGFIFKGQPGQLVTLEAVRLLPRTALYQFRAEIADWFAPLSWNKTSINRNAGSFPSSVAQPVPVVAAVLFLGLCCYGALMRVRPATRHDWRVVAGVFLVGWIALDLLWQFRVLGQLGETRAQYAGRSSAAKLAAGPDAALVEFAADLKHRLTSADARIFVCSDDDYKGMRSAYYLYPNNVYWNRDGAQLPAQNHLRSGDFIALLSSTELQFVEQEGVLLTGKGARIPVELVTSGHVGTVLRVR